MKTNISEKTIFTVSIIISIYFSLLFIYAYQKVDIVIIGVFIEIFTFPLILAQIVLLAIIFTCLIRKKYSNRKYLISAAIISIATTLLIFKDIIF